MGNRYGPRVDEFDWNIGACRRLKRYREAGLSLAEMALLFGVSRGAVAGAIHHHKLSYTADQQREMQARQAWERTAHGKRSVDYRRGGEDWESRLIETWAERKARRARETTAR